VEPEKEINYKLAQKDPLKFYDNVLNAEVTKTKVRKDKETLQRHEEEHKRREEIAGSPLRRKQRQVPLSITSKEKQKRGVAKVMKNV
jgi:uncharacterized glyoxalase superfamily protein PhnB